MDELEPEADGPVAIDVSTDDDGSAVVRISGELDISAVDALESEVAPVLANRPRRLVVDVSDLRFADSSAIALWVRWASTTGDFELRHPSPLLLRVITAMGLAEKLAVKR